VIFNAPLGGLLYMLEEVTLNNWAPELTLRAFICTSLATLTNTAMLNVFEEGAVERSLIFVQEERFMKWDWQDMPCIVAVAALLGACSAAYAKALTSVWSFRRRLHAGLLKDCQPWAKVAEASVYAAICFVVYMAVAYLSDCKQAGDLEGGLRLHCPEGETNIVGTQLLSGSDGAIKLFFSASGDVELLPMKDLAVILVAYLITNVGMMGLAVPMGSFIPNMYIGAVAGRLVGAALGKLNSLNMMPFAMAEPQVYALLGSAALLGGSLRQSLSIVIFLSECVSDFGVIPPLAISVLVAQLVAKMVSERGLDEELILLKDVPYLEPELPEAMEKASLVAADLCDPMLGSRLRLASCRAEVERVLQANDSEVFPVLHGGLCVGLVARGRLDVLAARDRELHLTRPLPV